MAFTWRQWLKSAFGKSAAKKPLQSRPSLETLEERRVFSTGIQAGGTVFINNLNATTEGQKVAQNTTLFQFTDSGANPLAADFTATIEWGDGTSDTVTAGLTSLTTTPAVIVFVGSSGGVSTFAVQATAASHSYDEETNGTFS